MASNELRTNHSVPLLHMMNQYMHTCNHRYTMDCSCLLTATPTSTSTVGRAASSLFSIATDTSHDLGGEKIAPLDLPTISAHAQ